MRDSRTRLIPFLLTALVAVSACAPRTPRVPFGALTEGLGPFLSARPLAPGQPLRLDEIGRTAGASYHLAQVRGSEQPHRHRTHDLTVTVLRGHGTLTLDDLRLRLAAGDVAIVPRGAVHWFANDGREPALALVTITPPAGEPDVEPASR